MLNKLIKKLVGEGKLKEQTAGIVQVEALLKQAILDLEEAKKISSIAERATYILAYMAMLKGGRALLLIKGYVPTDGAQHKTVVEVTSAILGDAYKDLTGQFEIMRRKRNEMTYEAEGLLTLSDAKHAFHDAISLVKGILKEAKSQNPQLELDFKL
ncbi:MAG: hypothetical protein ABIG92_02935 [Candidatus Omnitrophota bacterium]